MKKPLSLGFLFLFAVSLLYFLRSPNNSTPQELGCFRFLQNPEIVPTVDEFVGCSEKVGVKSFERGWILAQMKQGEAKDVYNLWKSYSTKIELERAYLIHPIVKNEWEKRRERGDHSAPIFKVWLEELEAVVHQNLSNLKEKCELEPWENCKIRLGDLGVLRREKEEILLGVMWEQEAFEEMLALDLMPATRENWALRWKQIRENEMLAEELELIESLHFKTYVATEQFAEVEKRFEILEDAYLTVARKMNWEIPEKIDVVFFQQEKFSGINGFPEWAGAIYDGKIRVPLGAEFHDEKLGKTLVHELTHAFLETKTSGAIPRWFHEGLAQWVEGRKGSQNEGRLRYEQLEAPFQNLSSRIEINQAYEMSLGMVLKMHTVAEGTALENFLMKLAGGDEFGQAFNEVFLQSPQDFFDF